MIPLAHEVSGQLLDEKDSPISGVSMVLESIIDPVNGWLVGSNCGDKLHFLDGKTDRLEGRFHLKIPQTEFAQIRVRQADLVATTCSIGDTDSDLGKDHCRQGGSHQWPGDRRKQPERAWQGFASPPTKYLTRADLLLQVVTAKPRRIPRDFTPSGACNLTNTTCSSSPLVLS